MTDIEFRLPKDKPQVERFEAFCMMTIFCLAANKSAYI